MRVSERRKRSGGIRLPTPSTGRNVCHPDADYVLDAVQNISLPQRRVAGENDTTACILTGKRLHALLREADRRLRKYLENWTLSP